MYYGACSPSARTISETRPSKPHPTTTTSDNDRIPYYKPPAAAEPTLQPTHPEPDDLRQETDDPPDPPEDKATAKYTLTKDRIFLGPPLGGALCFTFQAITLTTESPGLSGPFSLFAALLIGTAAGTLVELLVRSFLPTPPSHRQPPAAPTNGPTHPGKETTE